MKITDQNFIKYFKKGKQPALEYVIDKYLGIVKAVICNTLNVYNDLHLIEECISDTFLGAFENARQFKGDHVDFKKWLCTIAKFKAIDKRRKRFRTPIMEEMGHHQAAVLSAEDEYLLKESTEELLHIMSHLEKIDRDIFIMKFLLGMKSSEIAFHLGLTKASVDNRIYKGKKKLRKFHLGGIIQ